MAIITLTSVGESSRSTGREGIMKEYMVSTDLLVEALAGALKVAEDKTTTREEARAYGAAVGQVTGRILGLMIDRGQITVETAVQFKEAVAQTAWGDDDARSF